MAISLCGLSKTLPLLVGNLLDRESKLRKGRFREETLTDIFSGALAAFAGPSLVIEYPPEAKTGADIDLDFVHAASGRRLALRIQAKRLNALTDDMGKVVKPAIRSYAHLLHRVADPVTTVVDYQFRTLNATPAPSIPLYMFYNHGKVVRDPPFRGTKPTVCGINLAFADDIAKQMEAKVAKTAGSRFNKRLSKLQPHFFELDVLFCPGGPSHGEDVPTPDMVSERLREVWLRGVGRGRTRASNERLIRRLTIPTELGSGTYFIQRLSDGPSIRVNGELDCPRITLISGRTDAGDVARIADGEPQVPL